MGFLQQDTSNIIVDAVLTDLGRKKLAEGTFNVIKFAAGDDEVDYGMIKRYGRTVGQEKIEKNTPVFEAITNNNYALKYRIISLPDPDRYTLPTALLSANNYLSSNTLSLGTTTRTTATVTVTQNLTGGETMPPELIDNQFIVNCDDRFISIGGSTPVIDRNRMATYILTRQSTLNRGSGNGAAVSIPVNVKSITDAQFTIYGLASSSKTVISTVLRVSGMSSGTVTEFSVTITKGI